MPDINTGSTFGRPWLRIFVFALVCLLFAAFIPFVEIAPEQINQLPFGSRSTADTLHIENIFGGVDSAIIVISSSDVINPATLERVRKIASQLEKAREFDKVVSLFSLKSLSLNDGRMLVAPLLADIPANAGQIEALKKSLTEKDASHEKVISDDFRHTAIIASIRKHTPDGAVADKLKKTLGDCPGPETISISSFSVPGSIVSREMTDSMKIILPFVLLLMLITLFWTMRSLRAVALPFSVIMSSILPALGLSYIFGWKLQVTTFLTLPLMLVTVSIFGIRILQGYQENNTPGSGLDNTELAEHSLVSAGPPILVSGLVSAASILSLLSFSIVPIRQFAIIAATACALAIAGGIVLIPAWLSILKRPQPVAAPDGIERFIGVLTAQCIKHRYKILPPLLLIAVLAGSGLNTIRFDANPESYFANDAPAALDMQLVNRHFGGLPMLSILVNGDVKNPQVLKQMDQLERELESLPGVGAAHSIADVARQMNKIMHGGDEKYDAIPDDRETISNYFMQYSVSGDAGDFNNLMDFSYQHARIAVNISDRSSACVNKVLGMVETYMKQHKGGPIAMTGGKALLFAETEEKLTDGQMNSVFIALLLTVLITAVFFRSPSAGIITLAPPLFSLLTIWGLLGRLNVELYIPTALLSFLPVVIGCEYSILFLWRCKNELRKGVDNTAAVTTALIKSGKDIINSALPLLAGTSVFIFASFAPIRIFGIITVATILTSLIGALLLLPILCLTLKPSFCKAARSRIKVSEA